MVPIPAEDAVCRSLFIAQALLYGDNRKHTVVLVVPEWAEVRAWAIKNIPNTPADVSVAALAAEPAVMTLLSTEIEAAINVLKSYERPQRFEVIQEAFSQENQMLTPKMSIRRANVLKAYGDRVEAMYAGTGGFKLKVGHATLNEE